ncbi:hypothetical protein NC652_019952 [Populus alba x Populus x berolinensis]|nr:hypothetical protein NC652_019952 [Populus alba x Populus x berolinensis]
MQQKTPGGRGEPGGAAFSGCHIGEVHLTEDIRDVRFHKVEDQFQKSSLHLQYTLPIKCSLEFDISVEKYCLQWNVNIIRAFAGRVSAGCFIKHDNEQQAPDTDRKLEKQPQRNLKPR